MSAPDLPLPAQSRAIPVQSATAGTSTTDAGAQLAFASYLRVAAMAGVVAIHTLSAIAHNDAIRYSPVWWAGTSLDLGLSWAVPVFMMVSGALLLAPRPNETASAFYARRLQRIAIPLVVAHVGYLLVRLRWQHEALTVSGVIADLFRATVYVHLYFFWIILGLYLITPLLRPALAGRTRRELLIIGSACIGWMWAVQASARLLTVLGVSTQIWQPAALTLFLPYVGYFILGYALRDLVLRGGTLLLAVGVFIVASAVVVWQYSLGFQVPALSILTGGGYQGLPVAVTAVTGFLIGRSLVHPASRLAQPPLQAPLRHLGELSLGVFIIHLVVMRFLWLTPVFDYEVIKQNLPIALLLWIIVTVVSFAISAVIARVPIMRRTIGF